MKRKLLSLLALALAFQLQAQTWTAPTLSAGTIHDGATYYLLNTGLNLQLAAGGNWSTQAILASTGLVATAQFDANTNLYTLTFSTGKSLYRSDSSGMVYTDNTTNNQWNIELKDTANLIYTIQAPATASGYNQNQYLGTMGTKETTNTTDAYLVKYNRDKTTYANYIEWKFLSISLYEARLNLHKALTSSVGTTLDVSAYTTIYESSTNPTEVANAASELKQAVIDYKVANASSENPQDFTFMIVNQGFDNNTDQGWTGTGTINYSEVEFYQTTFNMYQTISELPAGKYTLKAQGFERPKSNDGGAAYRAGTETIYATLYAKATDYSEKTVPFNSLYQHTYSGTGASNGYVNTMAAAQTMFTNANNYYEITLAEILINEGNLLTIGAKSNFQQTGYWSLFDNFRLEYTGAFSVSDLVVALSQRIAEAEELLTLKVQTSVANPLRQAISAAQEAINAESVSMEMITATKNTLDNCINQAYASKALYDNLQEKINYANQVLSWYQTDEIKKNKMETAIATAVEASNNFDLTTAEINNAASNLSTVTTSVDKQTYTAYWSMGDINNVENTWSITRTKKSKNFILFWEKGYGENPTTFSCGNYTVNIDDVLQHAEVAFEFYSDSLKFIHKGSSKTDQYRMVIRLRYATEWEASGSGVDNLIGLLTLTPWAAPSRDWQTLYHEVGHCFQYQVHCDNNDNNGWMYGYDNHSGNGFWEQCAQWQAYKIKPSHQFTNEWFSSYLNQVHKHPLHEAPRYENFFIQDYWTYKHGIDFIGRLWNESKSPEDPIGAYKRITSTTQAKFNDEMWECAARFATWDIPALIGYGGSTSTILARPTVSMNKVDNNYWQIDPSMCIENYAHNIIRLNASNTAKTVSVFFEGQVGEAGFRIKNRTAAGWRYGFVALLRDGTRVYSDMGSATYRTATDTLHFDCPANTQYLWLVVSGAPSTHWTHPWDNDDTNDEQWPYKVKFNNTNRYGYTNIVEESDNNTIQIDGAMQMYVTNNTLFIYDMPSQATVSIYNTIGACVLNHKAQTHMYSTTLQAGIYIVNITTNTGNYSHKIIVP